MLRHDNKSNVVTINIPDVILTAQLVSISITSSLTSVKCQHLLFFRSTAVHRSFATKTPEPFSPSRHYSANYVYSYSICDFSLQYHRRKWLPIFSTDQSFSSNHWLECKRRTHHRYGKYLYGIYWQCWGKVNNWSLCNRWRQQFFGLRIKSARNRGLIFPRMDEGISGGWCGLDPMCNCVIAR